MAALPLPLQRRRVLTDSSAYLALLDLNDDNHEAAIEILGWLAKQRYRQYTTTAMLYEAHALILSELGTRQANQFLQEILQSNTAIIRIRASDEERARAILYRYTDKTFSYNDALSFVVMERLSIDLSFTFDGDFMDYGLTTVTLQSIR
jgi:predicted nucleic acid-binding protein